MFRIGDYVFDKANNEQVQVLEISEIWGLCLTRCLMLPQGRFMIIC